MAGVNKALRSRCALIGVGVCVERRVCLIAKTRRDETEGRISRQCWGVVVCGG